MGKRFRPTALSDREGWHYEVVELTFGRSRIIHTDGISVDDFW